MHQSNMKKNETIAYTAYTHFLDPPLFFWEGACCCHVNIREKIEKREHCSVYFVVAAAVVIVVAFSTLYRQIPFRNCRHFPF